MVAVMELRALTLFGLARCNSELVRLSVAGLWLGLWLGPLSFSFLVRIGRYFPSWVADRK